MYILSTLRKKQKRGDLVGIKAKLPDNYPVMQAVLEYNQLRDKIKLLGDRMDLLKSYIQDCAKQKATPDEKGNYLVHKDGLVFGTVRRVSVSLDAEKAEEILKDLGLWEEVTDVRYVINQDKLASLWVNQKITEEQLESMKSEKETFSMYSGREDAEIPEEKKNKMEESLPKLKAKNSAEFMPEITPHKAILRRRG